MVHKVVRPKRRFVVLGEPLGAPPLLQLVGAERVEVVGAAVHDVAGPPGPETAHAYRVHEVDEVAYPVVLLVLFGHVGPRERAVRRIVEVGLVDAVLQMLVLLVRRQREAGREGVRAQVDGLVGPRVVDDALALGADQVVRDGR